MYFVDFFKRITKKNNIPILIYLILNVQVITGIIAYIAEVCVGSNSVSYFKIYLTSIALYAISLLIALSPIGEGILRLQTGCRKIKRVEQISFIEPIFREVYAKAKMLDPSVPDNVQLYMNSDEEANAFATGRKTICITEGMLHAPEEQIKATLGHEFGHLAHKDTDLILVVSVGNLIITTLILVIKLVIDLFHLVACVSGAFCGGRDGILTVVSSAAYHALLTTMVAGLTWIWTKIGMLLVSKASRANEYEADKFALDLGYGNELCMLLDSISGSSAKGLFANLASSHPDKDDRIARLQELGATYRATYRV